MTSPAPAAAMDGWNGNGCANGHSQPGHEAHEAGDAGPQIRPMGLKVHYTFDREAKVNCLARYSHTLNVQTIPIDETTRIGVTDLRACIQAVTECSPELAGQDCDYTIYALDYSEPDTPLVGQGMLSWALNSMRAETTNHVPKMITGRVTKNLLGVFAGGNRETLEVRLKLASAAKLDRRETHNGMDMQQQQHQQQHQQQQQQHQQNQQYQHQRGGSVESALTPGGTAEWNSFIQSNPQIGQPSQVSRVASPALSQGPAMSMRRDSFGPSTFQPTMPAQEIQRVALIPVEPSSQPNPPQTSSRPSSRTSNRAPRKAKPPTGRPRGRPRKKPVEGNTSGYEDGTEGEDTAPAKKRAKTTKADKAAANPFAASSESLRVTASTSGSLRNFRPIVSGEVAAGSHLQEIPRAPTPVPHGPVSAPKGAGPKRSNLGRESSLSQQPMAQQQTSNAQGREQLSPNHEDGRSPESMAPTPNYSQDSPADIGSSPPVQSATPFIRSSPPPSSPVLPPMPMDQLPQDGSFGLDGMDELFGEEFFQPVAEPTQPRYVPPRRPTESRDPSGVPTQVFEFQRGPAGQDLVNICNYNTPHPTSTAGGPAETPRLPPMKEDFAPPTTTMPLSRKRSRPTSPVTLAPTPPPTTDALEKATTPVPAPGPTPEPMQAVEKSSEDGSLPSKAPSPKPASENPTPEQPQPSTQTLPPPPNPPMSHPAARPSHPRQLNRSQSAGPLALPMVPASEPAGPSSLSQSFTAEQKPTDPKAAGPLKRSASTGPLNVPVPASDPVGPTMAQASSLSFPGRIWPASEALPLDAMPLPFSPPSNKVNNSNKNRVKKHAIKQRLEDAILNGEMPPYCSNCGAIETPTWRKIWVQDHEGIPEYFEYSEKPGRVTAIDILKRDEEQKPTAYRLVKKSLGPEDDKNEWQELLLCNPCGIWLSKCKCHRPRDRWDKDASRLGQERRRRGTSNSNSRSKKSSARSDAQGNPTSEAYIPTDALGPIEPSSPKTGDNASLQMDSTRPESQQSQQSQGPEFRGPSVEMNNASNDNASNHGSTRSRDSGTVKGSVNVELDEQLGSTKRLLFPSPKKDDVPRALCEMDVNIVQTPDECRLLKETVAEKENVAVVSRDRDATERDGLEALFGSPNVTRPSTPPPNAKSGPPSGPFKTPTHPTPSHRPITRSVSRSLRSVRILASPSQQTLLQQTPSKTPSGSMSRRRSPRNNQVNFDVFDTPISRTISQMLSEPNGFGLGDSHLDMSSLPNMDADHGGLIDFGNLLSTDGVMPSSPPLGSTIGFDYSGSANVWAQWQLDNAAPMDTDE